MLNRSCFYLVSIGSDRISSYRKTPTITQLFTVDPNKRLPLEHFPIDVDLNFNEKSMKEDTYVSIGYIWLSLRSWIVMIQDEFSDFGVITFVFLIFVLNQNSRKHRTNLQKHFTADQSRTSQFCIIYATTSKLLVTQSFIFFTITVNYFSQPQQQSEDRPTRTEETKFISSWPVRENFLSWKIEQSPLVIAKNLKTTLIIINRYIKKQKTV